MTADPLAWIEDFQGRFKVPDVPGLPRFTGGLVGYFGYDTIAYIEPRLKKDKPDPLGHPDILLMVSEEVVVFDNLSGRLFIIVHVAPDDKEAGEHRLDELEQLLRAPADLATPNEEQLRKAVEAFSRSPKTPEQPPGKQPGGTGRPR